LKRISPLQRFSKSMRGRRLRLWPLPASSKCAWALSSRDPSFEGAGGNVDVAHFAINQRLYALKIGHKLAFGDGVMCVPMPPSFFVLPLRQMMLPLRGPTPVISQILAI
jgi:hypothetical protein